LDEARRQARRRRRSPEEAVGEIVAAAESFLRERPYRELTVDEVMRRTDLSRPSFYVYFRDRHHLVLRVVEHIGSELFSISDQWYGEEGADGATRAAHALAGVVAAYDRHGRVMRALADAAADDPDIEQTYGRLVFAFVDATARHIEAEIARGRIPELDAYETAKALILMNERYLNMSFGREPMADPEVAVRTLTTIWTRTLYGSGVEVGPV
jgi:TetR/AcrR family transcriptional regulator, ethionamide resistance regulator